MQTNRNLLSTFVLLLLGGALTLPACATTRTAGEQLDDSLLTARVGHRLTMDPEVPRHRIDVDSMDGYVTLRGEVDDERTRDRAFAAAMRTEGVRGVRSELQIRAKDKPLADGDTLLAAKVNNRLIADPDVRAADVDVDAVNGIVTLSGVVEDYTASVEAQRLARGVEGVERVDNQLYVARAEAPR